MLKYKKKFPWAETIIVGIMGILVVISTVFFATNLKTADYVVETNAFFAPFEFYEGREIVGVDVEIIDRVAERMNAVIAVKNVEFDVIIDNVEAGKIADAGAAGLTITPARLEKVDFSMPYYTSVQYVIYSVNNDVALSDGHLVWENMAGKTIGSQTGSTGYMFAADEIDGGVLSHTNTSIKGLDSHQLAADAISAHMVDFVICDELVANFIVEKNADLLAAPLYYSGENGEADYPVEESYAIAVNKERGELLAAFNDVLKTMTEKGSDGMSEIDKLVIKYMGLTNE